MAKTPKEAKTIIGTRHVPNPAKESSAQNRAERRAYGERNVQRTEGRGAVLRKVVRGNSHQHGELHRLTDARRRAVDKHVKKSGGDDGKRRSSRKNGDSRLQNGLTREARQSNPVGSPATAIPRVKIVERRPMPAREKPYSRRTSEASNGNSCRSMALIT